MNALFIAAAEKIRGSHEIVYKERVSELCVCVSVRREINISRE
jgi:hypothetical protein